MIAAIAEPGESDANDDMAMRDLDIEGARVLQEVSDLGGLHKIARLDALVTMFDAYNFSDNFSTTELSQADGARRPSVPKMSGL